jgi:predicted NUDIX family phosphoesterase
MSAVKTECVLVVPTELFHRLGHFQGFSADGDRYLGELLAERNVSFRPRGQVEQDPGFKQLIPYVILRHTRDDGTPTVFQYTRGTGQGEGRLHRKRSVGIGGHISASDVDGDGSTYDEGMRRELDEEVDVRSPYTAQCVGLINDDETDVGRVHLGVVHVFDLEQPDVAPREEDICDARFVPVDEMLADLSGFETWSRICLEALYGK